MRGRAFACPKSAAPAGRAVCPNRKLSLGDAAGQGAGGGRRAPRRQALPEERGTILPPARRKLRVECQWLDDAQLDPIAYDVVILRSAVERLANYRYTRSLTYAVDSPPPNGPAIGAGAPKQPPSRPKPKPRPPLVAPANPIYQPGQRVRYVDPTPGVVDQSDVGTASQPNRES
jgi:hypothetical protein